MHEETCSRIDEYLSIVDSEDQLFFNPSKHFKEEYFVDYNLKIHNQIFFDCGRLKSYKDWEFRKNEIVDAFFETSVSDESNDEVLKDFLSSIKKKVSRIEPKFFEKKNDLNMKIIDSAKLLMNEVYDFFGGTGSEELSLKCENFIYEYKNSNSTNLIYLGQLKGNGLCRHRSILFKLVCDHIGIECRILRGWIQLEDRREDHMWNQIRVGNDNLTVDTMNFKDFVEKELVQKHYRNLSHPFDEVRKRRLTSEMIKQKYDLGNGEVVGGGGFSIVCISRNMKVISKITSESELETENIDVAIKQINITKLNKQGVNNVQKLVKKEIDMMNLLKHPNIVEIMGSFTKENRKWQTIACIVMKKYDFSGMDFLSAFERSLLGKNLTPKEKTTEILILMLEIAKGIRYIHSFGIIHFDVKLENILINVDDKQERIEEVRVSDFGSSKMKDFHYMLTTLPSITYEYAAPEIIEMKSNGKNLNNFVFSTKSDVYSFGVMLSQFSAFYHDQPNISHLKELCLREIISERPSMEKVIVVLKSELKQIHSDLVRKSDSDSKDKEDDEPIIFQSFVKVEDEPIIFHSGMEEEEEEEVVFAASKKKKEIDISNQSADESMDTDDLFKTSSDAETSSILTTPSSSSYDEEEVIEESKKGEEENEGEESWEDGFPLIIDGSLTPPEKVRIPDSMIQDKRWEYPIWCGYMMTYSKSKISRKWIKRYFVLDWVGKLWSFKNDKSSEPIRKYPLFLKGLKFWRVDKLGRKKVRWCLKVGCFKSCIPVPVYLRFAGDNEEGKFTQKLRSIGAILCEEEVSFDAYLTKESKKKLPKIAKVSVEKWNSSDIGLFIHLQINLNIPKGNERYIEYDYSMKKEYNKLSLLKGGKDMISLTYNNLKKIGVNKTLLRSAILKNVSRLVAFNRFNYSEFMVGKKIKNDTKIIKKSLSKGFRIHRVEKIENFLKIALSDPDVLLKTFLNLDFSEEDLVKYFGVQEEKIRFKLILERIGADPFIRDMKKEKFRLPVKWIIVEDGYSTSGTTYQRFFSPFIREGLSSDYKGKFHTALIIGSLFLDITESSLCIPKRIPPLFDKYKCIVDGVIPYIDHHRDNSWVLSNTTFREVYERLSTAICSWNISKTFGEKKNRNVGNTSQDFVEFILNSLGVALENVSAVGKFMECVKENRSSQMKFFPSKQFRKKYMLDSDEVFFFHTHRQLDEFISSLYKVDELSLQLDFGNEMNVLNCFDRSFWVRHFYYPEDPNFEQFECPLGDPRRISRRNTYYC